MTRKEFLEKYPESRASMPKQREREFIEDAFQMYEDEGFSQKYFNLSGSEHQGEPFIVLGRIKEHGENLGSLPMWNICFADGTFKSAFPEEVIPRTMRARGCCMDGLEHDVYYGDGCTAIVEDRICANLKDRWKAVRYVLTVTMDRDPGFCVHRSVHDTKEDAEHTLQSIGGTWAKSRKRLTPKVDWKGLYLDDGEGMKLWVSKDTGRDPDLSEYEVVFDFDRARYYCYITAPSMDEALGIFFRIHDGVTYSDVVDHLEV